MTTIERQLLMNQSAIMSGLLNAPFIRSELSKTMLQQYQATRDLLRATAQPPDVKWDNRPACSFPEMAQPAVTTGAELADKIEKAKFALDHMNDGEPEGLGPTESAFFDLMEENCADIVTSLRAALPAANTAGTCGRKSHDPK